MKNKKFAHNKDKRICDECRHFYYKSELISNRSGQFCRECHKKIFSQLNPLTKSERSERYRKDND